MIRLLICETRNLLFLLVDCKLVQLRSYISVIHVSVEVLSFVVDAAISCQLLRPFDRPPVSRCFVIGLLICLSVRQCVLLFLELRPPVLLRSDLQLFVNVFNHRTNVLQLAVTTDQKACFVA